MHPANNDKFRAYPPFSALPASLSTYLTFALTHTYSLKPNTTATMPEYEQELPENIMTRILQIEDLISTQTATTTMMEDTAVGWLYEGDELLEELEEVVESLKEGWGFDVSFLFFFFALYLYWDHDVLSDMTGTKMQSLPLHPTPKYQKPYPSTNHHPRQRDAGTQTWWTAVAWDVLLH